MERLNAEIDVMIDEEKYDDLYKNITGKLILSKEANGYIIECFSDPVCTDHANSWWDDAFSFGLNEPFPIKSTDSINFSESNKAWSFLFWAKLFRAKIQEKSTDCYLSRLDDVVSYLGRHLPPEPTGQVDSDNFPKLGLYFYYLMELSAASFDDGSIGYATRASRLIEKFQRVKTDNVFKKRIDDFKWMASRWISYNKGLSYRHLGNYHKAALEFSDIIWQYEQITQPGNSNFYLSDQEKKLLYIPSILNWATILLQQQFSSHAIQILLKKTDTENWTQYKQRSRDLLVIQAYRQLERREESNERLHELGKDLFSDQNLFLSSSSNIDFIIPAKNVIEENPSQSLKSLRTRYVELAVNEYLERVKGVGYPNNDETACIRKLADKIKDIIHNDDNLIFGLKCIKQMYSVLKIFLPWVENNALDRAGYYRQLGELLSWTARVIDNWDEYDKEYVAPGFKKEASQIIDDLQKILYNNIYDIIEKIQLKDVEGVFQGISCPVCSKKEQINLFYLRNEDYRSLVNDLTKVLSIEYEKNPLKKIDTQRVKFLSAVAEKEEKKGENLFIDRLTIRNELKIYNSTKDCNWCMAGGNVMKFNCNFHELIACQANKKDISVFLRLLIGYRRNENIDAQSQLCSNDYDNIMEAFQGHFLRHLKYRTIHKYPNISSASSIDTNFHFFGLRRWNSISPAEGRSLGGGYILFRNDDRGVINLGIAIDPGYDFIRNLFHCGFSLMDIDIILISHSHVDHLRDFESLITLLMELKNRTGIDKRINVVLSLGAYEILSHIFQNPKLRRHVEPLVIDIEKDIDRDYFNNLASEKYPDKATRFVFNMVKNNANDKCKDKERANLNTWAICLGGNARAEGLLTIWPTRAYHDDYSGRSDSFGFIIEIPTQKSTNNTKMKFGYTGDTKWVSDELYKYRGDLPLNNHCYEPKGITKQYDTCDIVLVHLGSLVGDKEGKKIANLDGVKSCEKIVRDKGHPYFPGLIGFLNELSKHSMGPGKNSKLILLSEFGEELRGTIRTDLVRRLNGAYNHYGFEILPVDVGLDVSFSEERVDDQTSEKREKAYKHVVKFWCCQCRRFHPIRNVAYRHYGQDEGIFYLCRTCDKTTPLNVLHDRFRYLSEIGRTLRTNEP